MAINITGVRSKDVAGVRRRNIGNYVGPVSYANPGGDVLTAASLGLAVIEKFSVPQLASDANGAAIRGLTLVYAADGTTVTVRWYTDVAASTEVANAVDLSTYSVRFEAIGR